MNIQKTTMQMEVTVCGVTRTLDIEVHYTYWYGQDARYEACTGAPIEPAIADNVEIINIYMPFGSYSIGALEFFNQEQLIALSDCLLEQARDY